MPETKILDFTEPGSNQYLRLNRTYKTTF